MNAPDLPDEQLLVLTVLHAWQYQGRVRVGPYGERTDALEHVPDYYLTAELHDAGIDVASILRLLAEKQLIRMGDEWVDVGGKWKLPDGRMLTVRCHAAREPNGVFVYKTDVAINGYSCAGGGHSRRPNGMALQLTRAGVEIVEQSSGELISFFELVTLSQIEPYMRVSKQTLRRYVRDGKIPKPDKPGANGEADWWSWLRLRPYLADYSKHPLPLRFPGIP